jgi:UDP-glucose 4-epimerase
MNALLSKLFFFYSRDVVLRFCQTLIIGESVSFAAEFLSGNAKQGSIFNELIARFAIHNDNAMKLFGNDFVT